MEQHVQFPDIATYPWFCVYWIIAVFFCLFYGFKAGKIFAVDVGNWKSAKYWHQLWFNYTGSFIGWIAAYYLIRKSSLGFETADYFVAVIAFIGVTGHLPMTVMGVIQGAMEIAKGIINKVFPQ